MHYAFMHSTPQLSGRRRNIAMPFGVEKNEKAWLPDGEKSLMIMLNHSTEYRRLMDRQTDGQTSATA